MELLIAGVNEGGRDDFDRDERYFGGMTGRDFCEAGRGHPCVNAVITKAGLLIA